MFLGKFYSVPFILSPASPDKVSEKEEARKKKNAMGGQGIVGWLVGSLARLVGEVEYT